MRLELDDRDAFPRWSVRQFAFMSYAVRHVYRPWIMADVEYEERMFSAEGVHLTRTYRWADENDRRLLQAEMPFLKKAADLESQVLPHVQVRHVLHAVDKADRSVLIVLDDLEKYGVETDD